MLYTNLLTKLHSQRKQPHPSPVTSEEFCIVGLDPGETTGACVFDGTSLVKAEQLKTKSMPEAAIIVQEFLNSQMPDLIVMEEYRVYAWKASSHSGSSVHTLRLIGAIQYIAHIMNIPIVFQSAGEGKGFCTDEKLKDWGFYQVAKRHANDAIRHVTHYQLFGKEDKHGNQSVSQNTNPSR